MKAERKACLLALVPALAIAGVIALNAALAQGTGNPTDIVISEVMVNAYVEWRQGGITVESEWVEIYNKGLGSVNLAGWAIRDKDVTITLTTSMCPNSSCEIPPHGCWLIAVAPISLQQEFGYYTQPLSQAVLFTSTIFLSSTIGNGLKNDEDYVALLYTDGRAVDCVSWRSPITGFCQNLTYVDGGNGKDTALTCSGSAYEGQSITNIGGNWYRHQRNASPYNCINTAAGGSPTAVALSSFSARAGPRWVGIVALGGAIAAAMERKRKICLSKGGEA
jgi:hypothetical protein